MANWDFNDNNMYNEKYDNKNLCDKKYDDKKDDDKKCTNKKDDVKKDNCCCCAEGFRKALSLLNDRKIVEFIEFDTLGLITKKYAIGGNLILAVEDDGDNFSPDFPITLQCVDCNLIRTSAITTLSPVSPGSTFFTVPALNYWSLCDVDAVLLQVDEDLIVSNASTDPNAKIRNWNDFKAYFRSLLDKHNPKCDYDRNCKDCEDCCCSEDIFNQLDLCIFGNQGSIVNLTAGGWVGGGLEVLGRVGCILLLTNNNIDDEDEDPYIFFVCLNSIGGFSA